MQRVKTFRPGGTVVLALLAAGCSQPNDSIACMVPTYDVPQYDLIAIEARTLADMCTENWAKSWAMQSDESAGDIAHGVMSKCDFPYRGLANAEWPMSKWGPGVALSQLPKMVEEYRIDAVAYVIEARVANCSKPIYIQKHEWLPRKQP
jgi:hypothetical protein